MLKRLLAGGLVLGLVTSTILARPGVVVLSTGKTITGDVTEQGDTITVNKDGKPQTLARASIKQIVYDQSAEEQYDARYAKLPAKDVNARLDLAKFATDNGRPDLAAKVLADAQAIDPNNKTVAGLLETARKQASAMTTPQPPTTEPTKVAATQPAEPPLEWRLLTNDEINIVRQREMPSADPKVHVKFDNNVVRRFLAWTALNKAEFDKKSPEDQAIAILDVGNPEMTKDVRIITDPTPLMEFKQKVWPTIAQACGSPACHGGTKAGNFALHQGDSVQVWYTNFYVLTQYKKVIGGIQYAMVDRDIATIDRSLLLKFGQPMNVATPPHPEAAGFKPRFKTVDDAMYMNAEKWIKSLRSTQPDYSFKVAISPPAETPPPAK